MKPKVPEKSQSTPTTRLLSGDHTGRGSGPEESARTHPPGTRALAVALAECGVRAEEETVLNDLLTHLGTRSR